MDIEKVKATCLDNADRSTEGADALNWAKTYETLVNTQIYQESSALQAEQLRNIYGDRDGVDNTTATGAIAKAMG